MTTVTRVAIPKMDQTLVSGSRVRIKAHRTIPKLWVKAHGTEAVVKGVRVSKQTKEISAALVVWPDGFGRWLYPIDATLTKLSPIGWETVQT